MRSQIHFHLGMWTKVRPHWLHTCPACVGSHNTWARLTCRVLTGPKWRHSVSLILFGWGLLFFLTSVLLLVSIHLKWAIQTKFHPPCCRLSGCSFVGFKSTWPLWSFTDRKEFSPGGTVNERAGILPYISRCVLTHTYYNDTGHLGNHLELHVLSRREAASKKKHWKCRTKYNESIITAVLYASYMLRPWCIATWAHLCYCISFFKTSHSSLSSLHVMLSHWIQMLQRLSVFIYLTKKASTACVESAAYVTKSL